MFYKVQQIHFVGIGGAGMSGIAEVLLNLGYRVTGSDLTRSDPVKRLEGLGGKIFIGHHASNIGSAQVVVCSSAVSPDNVEVQDALERRIPVIPRAEMLSELMRMKYSIAISGAHGKTTTTSLVATILAAGGLDPTAVIGGKFNRFGSHAKLGQGNFLVAEADESDGSFLKLTPTIAVVTSIDREHMDFYHHLDAIKEAFLAFLNKVPFYGLTIVCLDQEPIQALLPHLKKRYVTYGMTTQADLLASDVRFHRQESEFTVRYLGRSLGRFMLPLPGLHNVYNALAGIAVGLELDVDLEAIRSSLSEFAGVERRFQWIGEKRDITIIDDYGHHPTEIKATLDAVRTGWNRRLVVVFQPHRYSRTRDLMEEFSTAFYQADCLILTEIYPAGEKPIDGISAERLYEQIRQHGHRDVRYIAAFEDIIEALLTTVRPRDMVVTLGAGDIGKVGRILLEKL
jgi:UDP-N-acetylmuramate--alanine ligase